LIERVTSVLTVSRLEYLAAAFRARRGDVGGNWSREMFNVTTSLAFPRERSLFLAMVKSLQRLLRVTPYSFENLPESF
jgi:hypothetical protein